MSSIRTLSLFGAVLQRECGGEPISLRMLDTPTKDHLARMLCSHEFLERDDGLVTLYEIKRLALDGSAAALQYYETKQASDFIKQHADVAETFHRDLGEVAFHFTHAALLVKFFETSMQFRYSPDVARTYEALHLVSRMRNAKPNSLHSMRILVNIHALELHRNIPVRQIQKSISDLYRDFIDLHSHLDYSALNGKARLEGTVTFAEIGSARAIQDLIDWYTQGSVRMNIAPDSQVASKWQQRQSQLTAYLVQSVNNYVDLAITNTIKFPAKSENRRSLYELLETCLVVNVRAGRVDLQNVEPYAYLDILLTQKAQALNIDAIFYLATYAKLNNPSAAKHWFQALLNASPGITPMTTIAARALYELCDENDTNAAEALLMRAVQYGCPQSAIECGELELKRGHIDAALIHFNSALSISNITENKTRIALILYNHDALSYRQLIPLYVNVVVALAGVVYDLTALVAKKLELLGKSELSAQWILISRRLVDVKDCGDLEDKTIEALVSGVSLKRAKFGR